MSRRRWLAIIALGLVLTAAGLFRANRTQPGPTAAVEAIASAYPDSLYAAGAHILIAHDRSEPPIKGVTRSRREAMNLAAKIHMEANNYPAGFQDLAREYSDDPRARQTGGYIGIHTRLDLPLPIAVALFETDIRQVHSPVETEQGFHILLRMPIRSIPTRHILIAWRGAKRADASVKRSREQARIIVDEVRSQCLLEDADFCTLAARFSDDVNSRFACGSIGEVEPAMVEPDFEFVLFRLKPGEISEVVETEYGFHIITLGD